MNRLSKFVAVALAAMLLLSVLPMAIAEGAADWEPFAENVSITIPVYDRGQAGVPNVEDNYWTKWIQANFGDKYNITVNYVAIPRTDVMTKYSMQAACIMFTTLPIIMIYPFLQKYFVKGVMIGAVKG